MAAPDRKPAEVDGAASKDAVNEHPPPLKSEQRAGSRDATNTGKATKCGATAARRLPQVP